MKYILPGVPTALCRPRFSMITKRFYNKQKEKMESLKELLKEQHGDNPFFSGPLYLDAKFYFTVPLSWSDKRRRQHAYNYHLKKPDLDNLVKFISDLGNGILYNDDSCISRITCMKVYSHLEEDARTEFSIFKEKVYDPREELEKEHQKKCIL